MPKGKAASPETYSRQIQGLKQFKQQPQEVERRADAWPEKPPHPKPPSRTLLTIGVEGNAFYIALTPTKRVLLFRLVSEHGQIYARVGSRKKIPIPTP